MSGPAATRRALLLLAVLGGCAGSDPQPLEPVSLDRFGGADSLVAGGGGSSALGYTAPTGSFLPAVRLVRHDAANPGILRPLGDVSFPGGTRITRLRVTDEAAALVLDGAVWVVDLADPSLTVWGVAVGGLALDVAVSGRWAAVAVDHGLVLTHRDDPSPRTRSPPPAPRARCWPSATRSWPSPPPATWWSIPRGRCRPSTR